MFQDEARFGRIADVRRCWCPKPLRPMVRAMVTQEYTYAYAAVCPADGRMDSLILPHVNGRCMQLFIDELAARYRNERIILILDGAGWHKSLEIRLPDNLRLTFLPPYAPELNPVEHIWMSCARSTSTTACSIPSMLSKTIWSPHYWPTRTMLNASHRLPDGSG